ncbi:MAG: zinc ribbon domain-containing protein [Acidobacteria bacterium]|nr:zinc ribbon domain-containing protein [Acidobacteriota bacterium]
MYCPRCGSQDTEQTKFCRQCGLPLQQITDYVATGGSGTLAQPQSLPAPPPPAMLPETSEMVALKQKRILTILSICIAPIIIAIIGESLNVEEVAAIPFILTPIGLAWAIFRYKTQLRRLQERQVQEYYAQLQYHQQTPQHTPGPKLIFLSPSNQPPSNQPQLNAPRTNPLAEPSRGSVVEDETRKFPEQRG